MINYFKKLFGKKPEIKETVKEKTFIEQYRFSTADMPASTVTERLKTAWENNFSKSVQQFKAVLPKNSAMDSTVSFKASYNGGYVVPEPLLLWYSSQTFIGYQVCALLSQHWLIKKACSMPARDASRNGYKITVNDGAKIKPEIIDEIRKLDAQYLVNENLVELVSMGRVFGIRVVKFVVDSDDPDYYYKPFNPDGIKPNSYRGMSQIDPYWITPQLDAESAGDPSAINFYEPTWWRIGNNLIHRSHLIIFKTEEVPDILKPTYIYGGIPVPQKIYERVYATERTANEAPMLALSKRTDVMYVDIAQALADQPLFDQRMKEFYYRRDNYGSKIMDVNEKMEQFDTTLADLDAVIMSQEQLVSAAADVPVEKLFGISPKGFNSTGEYESKNYKEELRSIQKHKMTPLLERHHLILIRSEICPKYNIAPFSIEINWNPLDEPTAKEKAELNKANADTGAVLITSGAISPEEERDRVINDPDSGYNGLVDDIPESALNENDE